MGRGRQKAKQTKKARELKYFSPQTDYSALQRELSGSTDRYGEQVTADEDASDEDFDDDYADYVEDEDEDDTEADWVQRR